MSDTATTEGLPLVTLDGTLHEMRARISSATDVQVWAAGWAKALDQCPDVASVRRLRAMNGLNLASVAHQHPEAVRQVERGFERRLAELVEGRGNG
ncbi:hypothetical protein [Roseomonas elaeocarpi]|uniref:Uncharacterized protein n=1 Tax=Roseomonas elaeocarpi TaxID=907779 RepID=A0ABV6JQG4_9PROT